MSQFINYIIYSVIILAGIYIIYRYLTKKDNKNSELFPKPFSPEFRNILKKRVRYYHKLTAQQKDDFERRILQFFAEKKITGVDTEVSDEDRLLVAASAIIPMFAFPYYSYPHVNEILLYPNSFDKEFQTNYEVKGRNILEMVENGFLNGKVLLSKPDLKAAFDGKRHKNNIGIHEFIQLIDKADGAVDGVPKILFQHSYTLPWIKEIKKEINKIKQGHSDINPYDLSDNAEFLAVVGEYFFDDPERMKSRHPELYNYLANIFHQHPDNYV